MATSSLPVRLAWMTYVLALSNAGYGQATIGPDDASPARLAAELRSAAPPATPEGCKAIVDRAERVEDSHPSEALAAYDQVIASGKSLYFTQRSLYNKARLCSVQNCRQEAEAAIAALQEQYPDSSFAVQARIVAAELGSEDKAIAQRTWAEEQLASPLFDAAMRALQSKKADEAEALLNEVAIRYPTTAAAVRAQVRLAYLLGGSGRTQETLLVRKQLGERLAHTAPDSPVALDNKLRLGITLLGQGRKLEGMPICEELASSGIPEVAAEALVHFTAAVFEGVQARSSAAAEVGSEEWEQIRGYCRRVLDDIHAPHRWRARAGLIYVETYAWQGMPYAVIESADHFLEEFDSPEFQRDAATVRLWAGSALYKQGRFAEALIHLRAITQAYKDQRVIWSGMDHLARAHHLAWKCLVRSGASKEEVDAAARVLLEKFPDSALSREVHDDRTIGGVHDR